MNRRMFLATGISAALAAPDLVAAQQPVAVRRLGRLAAGPPSSEGWTWFVKAMRERGWIEGHNVIVDRRQSPPAGAEAAARDLVQQGAELLMTFATGYAAAARRASTTVPIVMVTSGYPVEAGLAQSLSRPGGNVTGNTIYAGAEVWAKKIELLRAATPALSRLAIMWDYVPPAALNEELPAAFEEMRKAGDAFGVRLRRWEIRTPGDVAAAVAAIGAEHYDAVLVTSGPIHWTPAARAPLRELTSRYHLPTITDYPSLRRWVSC